MTVKELKEILETAPENVEVHVYATYDMNWSAGGKITNVYFNDKENLFEIWNEEG